MADGDIHFKISASDEASKVLDEFSTKMDRALTNVQSSLASALGKIESMSGGATTALDKLWDVVSNPSPVTILTTAIAGLGGAFLYLQNMVKQADDEFKNSNRTAEAMAGTWKTIADIRFANETSGKSKGAQDIAAFNRQVDERPLSGLSKEDAERRDSLRMQLDKYGAFRGGVWGQSVQGEIDALNSKEAEANRQDRLLRDQAKREYADQVNKRESERRRAEGRSSFSSAVAGMDKAVSEADFSAKTAGMSDLEKKLAEFDRQFMSTDTSKMSADEERQLTAAYEVERKRYATALELEESTKRKLELENEAKEATERAAAQAASEDARMTARGDAIRRNMMTPQERYEETKSELEMLRAGDKIDQQTFIRALAGALKESQQGQQKDAPKWGDPLAPATNNAPIVSRFLTRGAGDTWDPAMQLQKDLLDETRNMKRIHLEIRKWLDDYKAWIEGRGNFPGKRPVQPIPGGP